MVVPIRTLQAGAERIGSGELGHRLVDQDRRRAGGAGQPVQPLGRGARGVLRDARAAGRGPHARAHRSRWSSRPRRPRSCRSSRHRRPTCSRCSTPSPAAPCGFCGACTDALSSATTATQQHLVGALRRRGRDGGRAAGALSAAASAETRRPAAPLLDGAIIHVADVGRATRDSAKSQRITATAGYRAALAVPMLREGEPIGVIFAAHAASPGLQRHAGRSCSRPSPPRR